MDKNERNARIRLTALRVIAVLALLAGIAADVVVWLPRGGGGLIWLFNVIPGLLIILPTFLAYGREEGVSARGLIVAVFFLLVVGLYLSVLNLAALGFEEAMITDITRYDELLGRFHEMDETLVSHFPEAVPEEASEAAVYYCSGLLQSFAGLQLFCRLPSAEVEAIREKYLPESVRLTWKDGSWELPDGSKPRVEVHFIFRFGREGKRPPPVQEGDFENLLLDPDSGPDRSYLRGIAVSLERREVVWWLEQNHYPYP